MVGVAENGLVSTFRPFAIREKVDRETLWAGEEPQSF